jgi:hypothetical protein
MSWILLVWITSDLFLPWNTFATVDECYAALEQLELSPGVRANCVQGDVQIETFGPRKQRRKK